MYATFVQAEVGTATYADKRTILVNLDHVRRITVRHETVEIPGKVVNQDATVALLHGEKEPLRVLVATRHLDDDEIAEKLGELGQSVNIGGTRADVIWWPIS